MTIRPTPYSFFGLCFLIAFTSSANTISIEYVPQFIGGLDIEQIQSCEEKYEKICSTPEAKTLTEDLAKKWSCIKEKMAEDKSCAQAYQIHHLTYSPPTKLKKYGPVTVFNVITLADAQEIFYLVDTKGRLIGLTSNFDLKKNKTYQDLEKKYPKIALTTFLYWTKAHEDLFPQSRILHNKNQELIFRQSLRDGPCVACATVGITEVAYEFNPKGVFVGSHVVKVTPVPKQKEDKK